MWHRAQNFPSCELVSNHSFIYVYYFRKVTTPCCTKCRRVFSTTFLIIQLNLQGPAEGKLVNKSLSVLVLKV